MDREGVTCRIWPEFLYIYISCMKTTSCLLNENISQDASRQRASAGLKDTQGSGFEFTALLEGIPCIGCTNNTWSNDKFVFSDGGESAFWLSLSKITTLEKCLYQSNNGRNEQSNPATHTHAISLSFDPIQHKDQTAKLPLDVSIFTYSHVKVTADALVSFDNANLTSSATVFFPNSQKQMNKIG